MGRIPESVIQDILSAVDIVDLVSEYLTLKRAGAHFKGLCPFHQEKTPSFTVNPALNIYKCFGCGKGGNAIGFVMEAEGLSFPEAARLLAERVGVVVPEEEDPAASKARRTTEELLLAINRTAQEWFRANLKREAHRDGELSEYLHRRGLGHDLIESFQLGWVPAEWDGLYRHAVSQGFSEEQLLKSGLVTRARNGNPIDRYRGRLVFPIRNVSGTLVGFGGRIVAGGDADTPKYINSPETELYHKGRNLYGLFEGKNEARKFRRLVLVEGYMDLIALHAAGIGNVAASLGTALTREQALLIRRFAERVIFLYDGDAAGQKAMARGARNLLAVGLDLRVARLPEGQDPDDLLHSEGADALAQVLAEAQDYFLFRTRNYRDTADKASPTAYRDFVTELAGAAAEVEDLILRNQLQQRISHATGIPLDEVALLVREEKKRSERQADHHEEGSSLPSAPARFDTGFGTREARREKALFELFMRNPGQRERIADDLDLAALQHPVIREAFAQALRVLLGDDSSVDSWAHACENQRIRELALSGLVEAPRPGDAREVEDLLLQMERERLDKQLRELQARQREATPDQRVLLNEEFSALTIQRRQVLESLERNRHAQD